MQKIPLGLDIKNRKFQKKSGKFPKNLGKSQKNHFFFRKMEKVKKSLFAENTSWAGHKGGLSVVIPTDAMTYEKA